MKRFQLAIFFCTLAAILCGCATAPDTQAPAPTDRADSEEDAPPVQRCSLVDLSCEEIEVSELREECEAGEGYSCEQLSMLYLGGFLLTADPEDGLKYLAKACEDDYVPACTSYGMQMMERDEVVARKAFQRACDRGQLSACSYLGGMYLNGSGGLSRDPEAGLRRVIGSCLNGEERSCHVWEQIIEVAGEAILSDWETGCEEGDSQACVDLARVTDRGARGDSVRIAELFERACELRHPMGCFQVARRLSVEMEGLPDDDSDTTEVSTADVFQIVEHLAFACASGHGPGCRLYGQLLQLLLPNFEEVITAEQVVLAFTEGCNVDHHASCRALAGLLAQGDLVEQDGPGAVLVYHDACLNHDLDSCVALGQAYREGRLVERDIDKTVAAFANICFRGRDDACVELGRLYAAGDEIDRDFELASGYFEVACGYDNLIGCTELGSLFYFGQGVEVDYEVAVGLLLYACESGEHEACQRLQRYGEL